MDTPITTPVRSGFSFVPGSWGLIALRVAASLAVVAPAMMMAQGETGRAARSAFFSEAPLPMGSAPYFDLLGQALGGAAGTLPLMLVLGLIFKLLLDGGAMAWFKAEATGAAEDGVFAPWRVVFGDGWSWFWAMVRIALVPLLILTMAFLVLAFLMRDASDPASLPADRTAFDIYMLTPGIGGLVILALSWLTGALALHMRALSIVNGRRNTFVAFWRGLGILMRRPGQATLLYVLVTALVTVLSGAVVITWRSMDPRDGWLMGMVGLWLLCVVLQAYAWHGLTRSACLLTLSRDGAAQD